MLTITVQDQAFRQYLAQIAARTGGLTEAMSGIGQELESRILGRFETETDPTGHPWKPWAASTRKGYPFAGTAAARRMGGAANGRILDRHSPSATSLLGSLNWQADATSVRVGFGQDYAAFHEFGTARMPRRGMLFADPAAGQLAAEDERAVIDIITDYIMSA